MKTDFRSRCPVSSALDLFGDKWSLLIIRDMLILEKSTFKQFSQSSEKIASNILSSRLKQLEENKIIYKEKCPLDKKVKHYRLTKKGLALTPVITELLFWGDKHLRGQNPILSHFKKNNILGSKAEYIDQVESNYREHLLEDHHH